MNNASILWFKNVVPLILFKFEHDVLLLAFIFGKSCIISHSSKLFRHNVSGLETIVDFPVT